MADNGGGTYSMLDIQAAITGPGGNITMGYGAGTAEEGITVEMLDAKNTMTMGSDGSSMHSLHASDGGTVRVRLLKTSPQNARIMQMYNLQKTSAAFWGNNVFSMKSPVSGDSFSCSRGAFQKLPPNVNGKEGGLMEWVFDFGKIDQVLGDYTPLSVVA